MNIVHSLIFIFSIIFSFQSNAFCEKKEIQQLAIQQNGRVKPLVVHANEMAKFITGKSKINGMEATEAYCRLSLSGLFPSYKMTIAPLIEDVTIKEILNWKDDQPLSVEDIETNFKKDLLFAMRKEIEGSSLQKSIQKLLSTINIVNDIKAGTNWMIPEEKSEKVDDFTTINTLFAALNPENQAMSLELINKELVRRNDIYTTNFDHQTHHKLEYLYAKLKLPVIALFLTLMAISSFVLFKNFNICLLLSGLTLLVQLIFLIMRVIISGRAPVTNMYETVLFSGFVSLGLTMILGHLKKEPLFVKIGLGHNLLSIFMLNFSGGMLSASIGPLVPVLRDNFWLSTHVTSIISSYGALALSWVLANTLLIKNKIKPMDNKDINYYTDIMYTCLKFGVVLLAAGIILGGVWADYSWGRFWGWDPKETWSLIVLCVYMIILHGRYTNWINERRFIPLTAFAFLSVMMAWFGVNYILAAGLHSYGFSEGGAIFLGSFFAIQIAILSFTTPKIIRH